MNNLIRLSKTGIEYGDYAWNFLSGCSNNIDGKCRSGNFNCWAYSIVQRFGGHYPGGFKPTIYLDALISPLYLKKPSRILCAFMGDICDKAFNPDLPLREQPFYLDNEEAPYPLSMTFKEALYETMKACPQHRFYLLTKQPQNLIKISPFPTNCYIGVTVTRQSQLNEALKYLKQIEATVKFISFEPLLEKVELDIMNKLKDAGINWIIIGAQTKPYRPPKIEWVKEIVDAADSAGIPVFLKNNLQPIMGGYPIPKENMWAYTFYNGSFNLRQEMPDGK